MINIIRLSATWQTLFFLAAAILGIVVLAISVKKYERAHCLAKLAFMLYALAVIVVTLLSRRPYPVRFTRLNVIRSYRFTLWGFRLYNRNRKTILPRLTWAMREMILNVVLFLPIGAFLACLFPRLRLHQAALIGFLSSLVIEVLQFACRLGTFDLCDFIHNTLGTVFGFLLFRAICKRNINPPGNLYQ